MSHRHATSDIIITTYIYADSLFHKLSHKNLMNLSLNVSKFSVKYFVTLHYRNNVFDYNTLIPTSEISLPSLKC